VLIIVDHLFLLTAKLRPLETYVAYGYISQKSVEELIHRRAHVLVEGVAQPLTDNLTVERLLGEHNIICLEDLSHEIYTLGEHFEEAKSVLVPFKLTEPSGKFEKKVLGMREDRGGFKGIDMDAFLAKLL
jgi:large subunit ribosomal protein L7e